MVGAIPRILGPQASYMILSLIQNHCKSQKSNLNYSFLICGSTSRLVFFSALEVGIRHVATPQSYLCPKTHPS